jgi:hypothetical protein
MEVGGQLHAPTPFAPRKQLAFLVGWEVEWAREPVWKLWSATKPLARSLAAVPTDRGGSWDSVVGIAISYGLGDRRVGVSVLVG